jgi:hypothetical protein
MKTGRCAVKQQPIDASPLSPTPRAANAPNRSGNENAGECAAGEAQHALRHSAAGERRFRHAERPLHNRPPVMPGHPSRLPDRLQHNAGRLQSTRYISVLQECLLQAAYAAMKAVACGRTRCTAHNGTRTAVLQPVTRSNPQTGTAGCIRGELLRHQPSRQQTESAALQRSQPWQTPR